VFLEKEQSCSTGPLAAASRPLGWGQAPRKGGGKKGIHSVEGVGAACRLQGPGGAPSASAGAKCHDGLALFRIDILDRYATPICGHFYIHAARFWVLCKGGVDLHDKREQYSWISSTFSTEANRLLGEKKRDLCLLSWKKDEENRDGVGGGGLIVGSSH
jgi:hypothetical protein